MLDASCFDIERKGFTASMSQILSSQKRPGEKSSRIKAPIPSIELRSEYLFEVVM
jgi:hypothetical protein